jgi:hypothetical protein
MWFRCFQIGKYYAQAGRDGHQAKEKFLDSFPGLVIQAIDNPLQLRYMPDSEHLSRGLNRGF